jgi:hypothetical protein
MDNTDILIYTMPTFKFVNTVENLFENTFQLDTKLNDSIENLQHILINSKYKLIVGVAYQPRNKSYFYGKTINKFHRDKDIIKDAPKEYNLYIPPDYKDWNISSKNPRRYPTFCNLTFYKIEHFIKEQNLNVLSSYLHIQYKDKLENLKELLIHQRSDNHTNPDLFPNS